VLSVVSHIEVFPAVVVVVSYANPLSPAGCGETSLHCDISKGSIVIIAIEVIARRRSSGKGVQAGSIDQENVWPAVVVIIEDRHPGSGGLDDVFFCFNPT